MTSDKNKIIDLISKMSNFTADTNAFQGEISNASAKIQELMDKYSITWTEIHSLQADKQAAEYEKEFSTKSADYICNKTQKWHWELARLISRVTHTRHYTSNNHMTFFGTGENIEVATYLFTLWLSNINEMSKKAMNANQRNLYKKYPDIKKNFNRTMAAEHPEEENSKYFRSSWISGCLEGMSHNVTEQEKNRTKETGSAMVLYEEEVFKRYAEYAKKKHFSHVSIKGTSGYSSSGYEAGKLVGSEISIGSRPIVSGAKRLGG